MPQCQVLKAGTEQSEGKEQRVPYLEHRELQDLIPLLLSTAKVGIYIAI